MGAARAGGRSAARAARGPHARRARTRARALSCCEPRPPPTAARCAPRGAASRPTTSCGPAGRGSARCSPASPRSASSASSTRRSPAIRRGARSAASRPGSTSTPTSTACPTSTAPASRSRRRARRAPYDPDTSERPLTAEREAAARAYLAERFPALARAPRTGGRVCQYEMTADSEFLIAPHPEHEHVWLLGGGSGHGFKHGPALAELVRDLLTGAAQPLERHAAGLRSRGPLLTLGLGPPRVTRTRAEVSRRRRAARRRRRAPGRPDAAGARAGPRARR